MLRVTTTFEALADPRRREIIELLLHGELAVSGIVERLPIAQSGVSRHLRILREAGFVVVRKDGKQRFYSLRPEPFEEVSDWLARYRELWEHRLDRFGEELERRQRRQAMPVGPNPPEEST